MKTVVGSSLPSHSWYWTWSPRWGVHPLTRKPLGFLKGMKTHKQQKNIFQMDNLKRARKILDKIENPKEHKKNRKKQKSWCKKYAKHKQCQKCSISKMFDVELRLLAGENSEECQKPPTTTTSQKSIAIRLPFVLQYASNLYCSGFGAPTLWGKGILSVLLPFVSQYASHLYCNTPPICIAVLLGKSWWLWSPECSPKTTRGRREGDSKKNNMYDMLRHLYDILWHFMTISVSILHRQKLTDLFSRVLFFVLPLLPATPFSAPSLRTFSPFSPPRKVLCSIERRALHRSWRCGNFRMDLSTKFGKAIPSRNLHGNNSKSVINCHNLSQGKRPQNPGFSLESGTLWGANFAKKIAKHGGHACLEVTRKNFTFVKFFRATSEAKSHYFPSGSLFFPKKWPKPTRKMTFLMSSWPFVALVLRIPWNTYKNSVLERVRLGSKAL